MLIEKPSRRQELGVYCASRAVEAAALCAVDWQGGVYTYPLSYSSSSSSSYSSSLSLSRSLSVSLSLACSFLLLHTLLLLLLPSPMFNLT